MTDHATTQPRAPRDRLAVRWWLAVLSILLGVLFLVAAKLVAYGETLLRGVEASFWSGLFVNIGTSLLLAAVLIGLERVIVRKVREDRQVAVTQAAESAAQKTAEAFQPQLDNLDRRIRDRSASRIDVAAEAAQRVAELGNFDSVRAALADAADIDAISKPHTELNSWSTLGWEVIVPAGHGLSAPRMCVTFYPSGTSGEDTIMLSAFGHRTSSAVLWGLDKAPEEVFDELYEAMVRAGLARLARAMSAEALFRNLSVALRDAVLSRRAAPEAWRGTKPLVEMVSETVMMTSAGVEIRGLGLVIGRSSWGLYNNIDPGKLYEQSFPPRPEAVDPALWEELIRRGEFHYPQPDPDAW